MITQREIEKEEDKNNIVISDYIHWVNYMESFIIVGMMIIGVFIIIVMGVLKRIGDPIYSPISPQGELTFRGWGGIVGIIILVGISVCFTLRYIKYLKINKRYPRIITLCTNSIRRIYYKTTQEMIEEGIHLGDIEEAYRTFHILYNEKSILEFDFFVKFCLIIGFPLVIFSNLVIALIIILSKLLIRIGINREKNWSFYDSIIITSKKGKLMNIGIYSKEDYKNLKGFFQEKLSLDIDKLPKSWAHSYFFYRTDLPTLEIPLFFIKRR